MNKTIAIRVDGNSEIGFGHLMRMLLMFVAQLYIINVP